MEINIHLQGKTRIIYLYTYIRIHIHIRIHIQRDRKSEREIEGGIEKYQNTYTYNND